MTTPFHNALTARSRLLALALGSLALLTAGCGASTGPSGDAQDTAVTIEPTTASVVPSGVVPFAATVTGTTNRSVTWSVTEGASGGTVSSTGQYTAPTSTGVFHVVVASVADPTKTATALVTVTTAPAIAVSISPPSASTTPGGSVAFTAIVTGTSGSQSTAASWSVQEAGGGTVDASGRYSAPATAGTYHVVATSVADPTKSATAAVVVTSSGGSADLIPASRRTAWNPGIPGGIPARTTICATVTPAYASAHGLAAFATDGTGNAQPAIQYAMDNCPANQVVYLPAGTYRMGMGLSFNRDSITLRGAGADATKLRFLNNDIGISIWTGWPNYAAAVNVTTSLAKGDTQVPVANAASFAVGDIIQIDQLDDTSYLYEGMAGNHYFKRSSMDYGPATSAPRSMGQTVEVVGKSGNTLTISPALHLPFTLSLVPQVFKPQEGTRKWVGVEYLYITGTENEGFMFMNAAYSWVKGCESDGSRPSPASDGEAGPGNGMVGDHVILDRAFRCEVRDSYFHGATHIVQGGGAYGISLARHPSECLVENNIVLNLNKVFTLRASGGGNVIAYNYFDDGWTSVDRGLQETTLDLGHASFPFMELAEGNYAPQIATENVWGNSGWMTIFRNQATGKQRRTDAYETYQIAAIAMEVKAHEMNVIGNVLGFAGQIGADRDTMQYEVTSSSPGPGKAAVFRLGHGLGAGDGGDDINGYESPTSPGSTYQMLLRAGNWDVVRNRIDTTPAVTLPDSLYLSGKPAFFGSYTWPWVDPVGTTKTYVLPAKARFDAGTPNVTP